MRFAAPDGQVTSPRTVANDRVRSFLPTQDFERSKRFYELLGFEKLLDGEVAVFNAGSGGFILQRHFHKDWAANCMMQLMVDDLASWWARAEALDLPGRLGVPALKAPALQPWGLVVGYLVDPAGVLWHVAQRRDGAAQDL
jgi:predicted enzyme related to lactoylglutathione lyase